MLRFVGTETRNIFTKNHHHLFKAKFPGEFEERKNPHNSFLESGQSFHLRALSCLWQCSTCRHLVTMLHHPERHQGESLSCGSSQTLSALSPRDDLQLASAICSRNTSARKGKKHRSAAVRVRFRVRFETGNASIFNEFLL